MATRYDCACARASFLFRFPCRGDVTSGSAKKKLVRAFRTSHVTNRARFASITLCGTAHESFPKFIHKLVGRIEFIFDRCEYIEFGIRSIDLIAAKAKAVRQIKCALVFHRDCHHVFTNFIVLGEVLARHFEIEDERHSLSRCVRQECRFVRRNESNVKTEQKHRFECIGHLNDVFEQFAHVVQEHGYIFSRSWQKRFKEDVRVWTLRHRRDIFCELISQLVDRYLDVIL